MQCCNMLHTDLCRAAVLLSSLIVDVLCSRLGSLSRLCIPRSGGAVAYPHIWQRTLQACRCHGSLASQACNAQSSIRWLYLVRLKVLGHTDHQHVMAVRRAFMRSRHLVRHQLPLGTRTCGSQSDVGGPTACSSWAGTGAFRDSSASACCCALIWHSTACRLVAPTPLADPEAAGVDVLAH